MVLLSKKVYLEANDGPLNKEGMENLVSINDVSDLYRKRCLKVIFLIGWVQRKTFLKKSS